MAMARAMPSTKDTARARATLPTVTAMKSGWVRMCSRLWPMRAQLGATYGGSTIEASCHSTTKAPRETMVSFGQRPPNPASPASTASTTSLFLTGGDVVSHGHST